MDTPYIPFSAFDTPPFVGESVVELNSPKGKRKLPFFVKFFGILGIVFLIVSYGPSVWSILSGPTQIAKAQTAVPLTDNSWQPPFDKNLPLQNSISISSVGIKSEIEEASTSSFEDAMRIGVWRVNDFGTPYDRSMPTILTAHRFGYLAWSLDFRLHNSFYELPKVKVGDTVKIVWRQREYTYAVYKSEEGSEISDYTADLIMYTCRDLTSDIREIKYARLIKM